MAEFVKFNFESDFVCTFFRRLHLTQRSLIIGEGSNLEHAVGSFFLISGEGAEMNDADLGGVTRSGFVGGFSSVFSFGGSGLIYCQIQLN